MAIKLEGLMQCLHLHMQNNVKTGEFQVLLDVSNRASRTRGPIGAGHQQEIGIYVLASSKMEEAVYVGYDGTHVFVDMRRFNAHCTCPVHARDVPLTLGVSLFACPCVAMCLCVHACNSSQDSKTFQSSFRISNMAPFPKPKSGVLQLHVFLDRTGKREPRYIAFAHKYTHRGRGGSFGSHYTR